jgi:hypothetical protein
VIAGLITVQQWPGKCPKPPVHPADAALLPSITALAVMIFGNLGHLALDFRDRDRGLLAKSLNPVELEAIRHAAFEAVPIERPSSAACNWPIPPSIRISPGIGRFSSCNRE